MNRKNRLSLCVSVLALIGLAFTAHFFIHSMKPSARAHANLASVDISTMKLGSYQVIPHPKYENFAVAGDYGWGVLILKAQNGTIQLWNVPIKNDHVGLPDQRWNRPIHSCKHFGPTMRNGKIDPTKTIKCHDREKHIYSEQWQWTLDGKSSSPLMSDLSPIKGRLTGNYFVFM